MAVSFCDKTEQWRWSSAKAHIDGKDDQLVRVKPMLNRIDDWHSYLTGSNSATVDEKPIQKHTRTSRPLGSRTFASDLE